MNFQQAFFDEMVKIAMTYDATDKKGRAYFATSHADPHTVKSLMKMKGIVRGVVSHGTGQPQWEDEDPGTVKRVLSTYLKDENPKEGHYYLAWRKK